MDALDASELQAALSLGQIVKLRIVSRCPPNAPLEFFHGRVRSIRTIANKHAPRGV